MADFNTFGILTLVTTKIGAIQIDVSTEQNHRYPSRITENPVEDGTVFTDHQVLLPAIIEINGRVSDSSVSLANTFGKMSAKEAWQALIKLQADRTPFDVHTGLDVYTNMMLEDLSAPRATRDGRSIRFTAILREIQITGRDTPTNRDRVAADVAHSIIPVKNLGVVSKVLSITT